MFKQEIRSRDMLIKVIDSMELLGKTYTINSRKVTNEREFFVTIWMVTEIETIPYPIP